MIPSLCESKSALTCSSNWASSSFDNFESSWSLLSSLFTSSSRPWQSSAQPEPQASSQRKRYFFTELLFAIFFLLTSGNSLAKGEDLLKRIEAVETSIEKLEAQIEILSAQNRMVIQRTTLAFLDSTYVKGGLSLLLPRQRSFSFTTDTGLGAFGGVGHYFGRNHVAEIVLDYDVYPAMGLRYRYDFHLSSPLLTIGPMIGYRIKIADIRPFDNFVEFPSDVKGSFFMVGCLFGFPLSRSMITMEAAYLFNAQSFLVANAGVHFFL